MSPCDSLLDEKLCQVTVRVLGVSSSPEVSELCLELLHGQAENGKFLYYAVKIPILFAVRIMPGVYKVFQSFRRLCFLNSFIYMLKDINTEMKVNSESFVPFAKYCVPMHMFM